jgi:hypothetical protein
MIESLNYLDIAALRDTSIPSRYWWFGDSLSEGIKAPRERGASLQSAPL